MRMRINAAGSDDAVGGIDLAAARAQALPDRHKGLAANADVGPRDPLGKNRGATSDDH